MNNASRGMEILKKKTIKENNKENNSCFNYCLKTIEDGQESSMNIHNWFETKVLGMPGVLYIYEEKIGKTTKIICIRPPKKKSKM